MSNKKIEIDMTGCLRKRFSVFVCGVCEGGLGAVNMEGYKWEMIFKEEKQTTRAGLKEEGIGNT